MSKNKPNKKSRSNKSNFDKSIAVVMKDLISDMSYYDAAIVLNNEIRKILSLDDGDNVAEFTTAKISRYIRGETTIPVIVIAALCQYAKLTGDEFFMKVFEEQGLNWNRSIGRFSNYPLPEGFEYAVIHTAEDTNQLAQEFKECIRQGEIRSKFAYFGTKVTERYIKLMHSGPYVLNEKSANLLKESLDEVLEAVKGNKPIRIISLGIGDGEKDALIIEKLFEKTKGALEHKGALEYYVFDISIDMIKIGLNTVKEKIGEGNYLERLDRKLYQMDFMHINRVLNESISDKQNIFLLLGNTLGNFPEDILLGKINEVLQPNDFLLIDNQLKKPGKLSVDDENRLLSIYADSNEHREYMLAILDRAKISPTDGSISPARLSYDYGIKNEWLRNHNCATVLQEFTITNPITVEFGDESLPLGRNKIITVLYSKKYTKEALTNIVSDIFTVERVFSASNEDYALMLCKKSM